MNKVSLWEIFAVFAKIGAFTIGGGYMMIPAIQAEMSRRRWISDEELPDIVAIAQSAPGLLTVNMSIFAGYKLRGIKGSIVATTGAIAAPFIMILLIAMFFASFRTNPVVESIFKGVRPAAVAVIAAYTIKQWSKFRHWWQWCISLATLAFVAMAGISPIYILATVIVCALALTYWREEKK